MHLYEIRPRKDKRGITLICDALAFGRLWYTKVSDAVDYAKFYSRSPDAMIRVYDAARRGPAEHLIGSLGRDRPVACLRIL